MRTAGSSSPRRRFANREVQRSVAQGAAEVPEQPLARHVRIRRRGQPDEHAVQLEVGIGRRRLGGQIPGDGREQLAAAEDVPVGRVDQRPATFRRANAGRAIDKGLEHEMDTELLAVNGHRPVASLEVECEGRDPPEALDRFLGLNQFRARPYRAPWSPRPGL